VTQNYKTELIDDPEIKALLNNIKPDGNFQILRSLCGSRKNPSQNTVFEICVFDDLQNHWADMVIKIGDCKPIKDEFDNFSKYVLEGPLRPEYKVILHEPICGTNKAIMRIDFMNSEIYQTLIDYYKENPIAALKTLLNSALKPWHQKMKDISCKSNEHMPTRLKYQKEDLLNECERLFPEFAASSECLVQMLKRVCINPVVLLQKDEIDLKKSKGYFWSGESIVHGDLNFNNILIENENHLKLIDFEYTRRDIIFDDLARLECEIKFICMRQNDDENFCKGLLDFEELITHNLRINVDELPENAKVYEDIKKAAKCIAVIRERAYEIIQQSDQITEIAYWIELLIRTLKYVSYQSEDGISQLTDYKKKYALISALLLSQNYLKEPEIKTLQPPLVVSICPEKHELEYSPKMHSAITKKRENSEKDYPVPAGIEKIESGSFIKATQDQILQYYDGNQLNWGIIAADGIIERDEYNTLVEEWIPPTCLTNMICIVGDAGEGKSSLAWKFVYEIAKKQDIPIYRIWNSESSVWTQLIKFYNEYLQKPFIVLVDDVFRNDDVMEALQNIGNQIPMTILATSRTNEYRGGRRLSFDVKPINLKRPSSVEKDLIIKKIGNSKSESIEKDLLEESVPFLVFMMEVTHGKEFTKIIRDEIERLKKLDPIVYKAYRYVCSTYRFQISIPKPLLERIDNDFYDIEIEEIHPASAGIIIEDDYFIGNLRARHPLIAEHSLKYYIGRDTTIDKMFNVIDVKSIIERKSMLHLFREMAKNNHPDLDNILSVNKEKIEDVFKNATISEMAVWRFIFEKINAEDMIPRCMDIALSINPVSGSDCIWLKNFYQEKGEEIKSVPKIKEYLDVIHPEDSTVRAAYLGLVERNGTQKQKEKIISDTKIWLSENPKDTHVRAAYLGSLVS
jgi:thiamine kinase-like enzyme